MHTKSKRLDLDPGAKVAAYTDDDREHAVNPDFSQRIVVDTQRLAWQPSPEQGVERKRLELIGDDNTRLTTLVRFAPGSRFEPHGHDGGEEFLVLKGTFSDKSGDFQAGVYVRNPTGWVHGPWSDEGCELFVKLRQHHPEDKERVVIDTRRADWPQSDNRGLTILPLHRHGDESIDLCQLTSGAQLGTQIYPGGAELLIIEGEFTDEIGVYPTGTWLRLPTGTKHAPRSDGGCLFYLKTGHFPTLDKQP